MYPRVKEATCRIRKLWVCGTHGFSLARFCLKNNRCGNFLASIHLMDSVDAAAVLLCSGPSPWLVGRTTVYAPIQPFAREMGLTLSRFFSV